MIISICYNWWQNSATQWICISFHLINSENWNSFLFNETTEKNWTSKRNIICVQKWLHFSLFFFVRILGSIESRPPIINMYIFIFPPVQLCHKHEYKRCTHKVLLLHRIAVLCAFFFRFCFVLRLLPGFVHLFFSVLISFHYDNIPRYLCLSSIFRFSKI